MITKENLRQVLLSLGFAEEKNVYIKHFDAHDCDVKVDFANEKLIYPEGLEASRDTTKDFHQNENFVVLECVCRLLEKGYAPQNIVLEQGAVGGHGLATAYLDILVKDNNEKEYLLIECKTAGDEFDKAWKKMLQDGGQLFNYFNSFLKAEYLCLYASDYEDGKCTYTSNIISLKDNKEYLLLNKKLIGFESLAKETKEAYFKVWKETYQQDYSTQGVFEKDIAAFGVGNKKYSIDDLQEVDNATIQKKYHEFATILRQHNVSGRENAFDKLVNLFLAKIVDETTNAEELLFYWKGAAYDDYFNFQDRLQKMYKEGMQKFLGETVTYIDNKQIAETFHLFKNDPDATKEKVLDYFRQLKFFTNNDFAFLDVHNEYLFFQNAEILKKIVQMLQDIKLKTEEQNQFLGDLFEGFLDQGVKQSEGQFFTPMPIVKFLISSLPLEKLIKESTEIPKVIDYACGAGHFLNEYAQQIKPIVKKHSKEDLKNYYAEIVGIEKEYRLSKVAKVSAFMYGQDEIKIIYSDALATNEKVKDNTFSVLVANPPYSVKGFLETLTEEERERFELTKEVTDIVKNNSIETFFVERASQLLKGGGVAAIVLPSSILSNGNIYTKCREIILKCFDIVAIAEFGSGTFGKTGTNTATLFLRRKSNNPNIAEHYKNRVEAWFKGDFSKDGVFADSEMLHDYCSHTNVEVEAYKKLLQGEGVPSTEIFAEYRKAFENDTRARAIKKKRITEKYTKDDQNEELEKHISDSIREAEKEKLYFYLLAKSNGQPVLIAKSPSDSKAIKTYLGYEWSGAKGNEGIKYIGASTSSATTSSATDDENAIANNKGINRIQTPLFDPNDLANAEKINTLIRQNFLGNSVQIPQTMEAFVTQSQLCDMLDFSRVEFDKALRTSAVKKIEIASKYPLVKIKDICEIGRGRVINHQYINEHAGTFPVYSSQTSNNGIMGYIDTYDFDGEYTTWTTDGIYAGTCFYRNGKFNCTNVCGTLKVKDSQKVCNKILSLLLNQVTDNYVVRVANPKLMNNVMAEIKIPLPPLEIQQQIVAECEKVDEEYRESEKEIENVKKEIAEIVNGVKGEKMSLKKIAPFVSERIKYSEIKKDTYVTTDNLLQDFNGMKPFTNEAKIDSVIKYQTDDILLSNIRPYLKKMWLADKDGGCSPDVLVLRTFTNIVSAKMLSIFLKTDAFIQFVMGNVGGTKMPRGKKEHIETYTIPIPPIAEQERIVKEIEALEQKIAEAKTVMDGCAGRKQEILQRYL